MAHRDGLSLSELARHQDGAGADPRDGGTPLPFAALQLEGLHIKAALSAAYETNLLKFAGEVGLLMTGYQTNHFDRNRPALTGNLIPIFRALVATANDAGVTLEQAAGDNLEKIFDRWPQGVLVWTAR